MKNNNFKNMGLNWVFDEIFVREKAIELFDREKVTGIKYSSPMNYLSINRTLYGHMNGLAVAVAHSDQY